MVVSGNTKRPLSKYQLQKRQKCVLRTLDSLPMKYGRADSQRLATSCRSVRSGQMDEERLAKRISENQTSESRRLFEDVLNKTGDLPKIEVVPRNVWNGSTQYTVRIKHTGPTRFGSPLYSQKPAVSAQSHHSQFIEPPRYFQATPAIERTLQRSTSAFRVIHNENPQSSPRTTKSVCETGSSFPDFILVPNPDAASLSLEDIEDDDVNNKNQVKTYHIIKGNHAKRVSSMFPEPETMIADDLSLPADNYRKVAGNNKTHKKEKPAQIKGEKDNDENKIQKEKTDSAKSSKDSTRSQKVTKPAEVVQSKPADNTDVKSNGSKNSQKNTESTTDKQSKQAAVAKPPKKTTKKKGKNGTDLSGSSISEGLTEQRLPDYICPSSEEKSKEARIRHWLRETSFSNANRHVPLV